MTVAAPPPAPPSVHEHGMNGSASGHAVNMSLPRFHPIAMNPNQPIPSDHAMQNHLHYYRPFPPPPQMQEPGPLHHPPSIDHIEARLRQLEQEEAARMASRSQLLAIRKREDEEFRRMTEHAEAEEEELRRQRKRLKRESMGLGYNATIDSPPLRPTPPRRLSETNAATTLAFFKQQSPPEPRPIPQPPPAVQAPPSAHPSPQHIQHDHSASNSIRRKQKYTIKNVEAWGERHGRPAAHDPSGRALWKRPSDDSLVYLTCPVQGCGKADFVTLHGFMCHLTKKHKDRSLGSQSRALELCGVIFDPNAPLPPVSSVNRASTEESRIESANDMEYSSMSDDECRENPYPVKSEPIERPLPAAASLPTPEELTTLPKMNGSAKQSISSILDRDPATESRGGFSLGAPQGLHSTESALRVSGQYRGCSPPERAEIPPPRGFKTERMEPREVGEAK